MTDRLLELQGLDTSIDRAEAQMRALESGDATRELREAADEAERRLGELRLTLDELIREQTRLEHDVDSLSQKAAAEEKRLYDGSIANAKELEALQHEIANLKERRSHLEDELLERMEHREDLEASVAAAEREADQGRRAFQSADAGTAGELQRLAGELAAARERHAAIVPEIDVEVLELYEELRRTKKGIGAAALVDGVCQGCHETLSALQLDRLKHSEAIRRCEHCRRIVVFA